MGTYLFDFDGTLVDSMPTYAAVMLNLLKEHNIPYSEDILKIITPLGYRGTAAYFRTIGMPLSEEEIVSTVTQRAVEAYTHSVPAKAHVINVLHAMRRRGDSLNVLTASPHAMLDPCLRRLGIFNLFDHVWSCEDFGTTKSDPAIYHMAAERISQPVERILFLDDNLNADQTAKASGMKVCGVYDDSSKEYEEQIRAACDHYIFSFHELMDIVF